MCTKMRKSAFSDTLNIMRGRARIIKEEEIYIERFYSFYRYYDFSMSESRELTLHVSWVFIYDVMISKK